MLDVVLHDTVVGTIGPLGGSGRFEFVLSDEYFARANRDVLGQQFENRRDHAVFRTSSHHPGRLPAFFANLLPEGALRTAILATSSDQSEAATLASLGDDLPGAVRVRHASGKTFAASGRVFDPADRASSVPPSEDSDLRFSLAGIQPKLSAVRDAHDRFVLPVHGLGGDWIVKFASSAYPALPENEFATMGWAARCGIATPKFELMPISHLTGLPNSMPGAGTHAFVIKRFDRVAGGHRIHQEDFAQVLGVLPEAKYQGVSYEKLAQMVADLAGMDDLEEFLRRLWFSILAGNTDAHLKNWSFVYPTRRLPRLSPAYDLVFVRQFIQSPRLALPLAQEKDVTRIDFTHVARLERFLKSRGIDRPIERDAREFVARSLDTWASIRGDLDERYRSDVDRHLQQVPLAARRP